MVIYSCSEGGHTTVSRGTCDRRLLAVVSCKTTFFASLFLPLFPVNKTVRMATSVSLASIALVVTDRSPSLLPLESLIKPTKTIAVASLSVLSHEGRWRQEGTCSTEEGREEKTEVKEKEKEEESGESIDLN